jgi:hypothetical protein
MTTELACRRSRLAQTRAELTRLASELTRWFEAKRDPGFLRRHGRQLQLLNSTLTGALTSLRQQAGLLSLTQPTADCYRACRAYELRGLWVRALWQYFRPKFEQREDSTLKSLLTAADEVVWACYAPAFERLGQSPPPAPLPYVEPQFTPRAIPLDEPPPELKLVDADFLAAFLERLPIAVVGLPSACVSAPWWLAHAAHEVGHHVQHELKLVTPFELALRQAAEAGPEPLDPELADHWVLWGQEVFADAYGLLCLGPAAPRALAEVELSSASLTRNSAKYPAAVVRLEWQRRALQELEVPADDLLGLAMEAEFQRQTPQLPPDTAAALAQAQRLGVWAMRQQFSSPGGEFKLTELAAWEAKPFQAAGDVADYAQRLRAGQSLAEARNTVTIRHVLAAGVKAWDDTLAVEEETAREQEQGQLARVLVDNLIAHSPPGDRVTRAATPDDAGWGRELGELLLARTAGELTP